MSKIQRSIEMGDADTVIVHAGQDCTVQGYDGDRVLAESEGDWGMNVKVVVRVGRFELFRGEWRSGRGAKVKSEGNAVEVNAGGSCVVNVPSASAVKVYAGKYVVVEGVRGPVLVNAGEDVRISGVALLDSSNCGRNMDIDCDALVTDDAKFNASKDMRIRVRQLTDARVHVNDMGGYWEGVIGDGTDRIRLTCGGEVTLVTDKAVRGRVLGRIEKPA